MTASTPYPSGMAGRPAQRPRTRFGERLVAVRDLAGVTQVQLAEKLATTQSNVANWERETVALRPEQLAAIADALGVTTDYLLGRSNAKQPAQGTTRQTPQCLREGPQAAPP